MLENFELLPTSLIMIGLGFDAIGAIILVLFSSKTFKFFADQMNRSVSNENIQERKKLEKQEKDYTSLGLIFLIIGFFVQIIGYSISNFPL